MHESLIVYKHGTVGLCVSMQGVYTYMHGGV